MNNSPKILVACPTYEGMAYCLDKFIERINSLTYPDYDILIVDNSKTNDYYNRLSSINRIKVIKDNFTDKNAKIIIVHSRNLIIDYALENNYDFILMMDQDVIPPNDIIELLLSCDKDIV